MNYIDRVIASGMNAIRLLFLDNVSKKWLLSHGRHSLQTRLKALDEHKRVGLLNVLANPVFANFNIIPIPKGLLNNGYQR